MLLPQSRTSDWRSSSLRLSRLGNCTRFFASSPTLRLCLTLLHCFGELALLAAEICRKKVENHPLLRSRGE
jgi:hypothetical protein